MCEVLIVDGAYMMVQAKGHATGSQDCCSAVSSLVYALAGFLKNDAQTRVDELTLNDADARIVFAGKEEAKGALQMAKIGFLQLQMAYPEFLRVDVLE